MSSWFALHSLFSVPLMMDLVSLNSQHPYPNYGDLRETLRSIQEEQASIRAYVASEHAALCDFVQEQHDELRWMIASQTQNF